MIFVTSSRRRASARRQGLFTPTEAQAVATIWSPTTQPHLTQQLVAVRSQRNELAVLNKELDALQATDADYRRIDSIKARGDALGEVNECRRTARIYAARR